MHSCIESTGIYGEKLAYYLHKNNLKISVANPIRIKGFGKSNLSRTKTDESDAKLIANFCKSMIPDLWLPIPEHVQLLRGWVRRLEALKAMKYQESNRIEAACDEVRKSINTHISMLDDEIKKVEERIQACIKNNPELYNKDMLLKTIPGIGNITSALTLSFLWEINNFTNAKQAAAYVGVNPQQRQSGSTVRGKARISKIGDSQFRKGLYMPAMAALRFNPVIKEFGKRLAKNGKNKMQIIVAAMMKLIHIMYGVLKSGKPFDAHLAAR